MAHLISFIAGCAFWGLIIEGGNNKAGGIYFGILFVCGLIGSIFKL